MLKRSLIAIVVVPTLWVGVAAAEAAKPPLGFTEQGSLSVSCADLVEGQGIAIRNETASRRRIRLSVSGLENADGKVIGLRKVCGGLRIKVPVKVLGPGRSTKATLTASSGGALSYSGSLMLFARIGRVARREIAISPTPEPELSASPLVDSQSVERSDLNPFDGGLVWVPVSLPDEDIPAPPESPDGTRSSTVGALAGVNGTIPVTYEGDSKPLTPTTSLVGLKLGGYEPGSYSGKVDLMPGTEEGDVTLDLKVTTWAPIPAIVLLIGIVFGVLLQRQSGRRGPRARLLQRIDDLEERHGDATAKLRLAAGAPPGGGGGQAKPWGAFSISQLPEVQTKLREQVEQSTEKAWIQIDKAVLDDLEARIAVVEGQIDLLEMVPDLAGELEEALTELEANRPAELPPLRSSDAEQPKPSLDAEARLALVGAAIGARKLQGKLDAVRSQAAAARNLQELEERLHQLWMARRTLDDDSLSKSEEAELETRLAAIRHLLWGAESSEDLESAAKQTEEAAMKIASLWHKLPKGARPLPPHVQKMSSLIMAMEDAEPIYLAAPGVVAEQHLPPSAPGPVPAAPLPKLSVEEAESQISKARFNQGLLVLVAAAVALASGLGVLYVGKPWGSFWDYVAALGWGLAAQTLVLSLATSIDGLGALRARRSNG
jgi:hypothetical protein